MSVDVRSDKLATARRRERRGRAARQRLHLHRGADLEPGGRVPALHRHAGRHAPALGRTSGVQVVASPSNKGNGMTLDADGRLIVCEHSTSSLVRMDPDGTGSSREVLASHYEGKELNSPNDVSSSRTARSGSPTRRTGACPVFGVERERELGLQGVFRIAPGGGDPQLVVDQDEYEQPNGLCFSPDESLLYINDTPKRLDQGLRRRLGRHRSRTAACSSRASAPARSRRAFPTG